MYTVLGGNGFIGRHVAAHLAKNGAEVKCWSSGKIHELPKNLGHAIYCIGMTSDFRSRPAATMEAHVTLAGSILEQFEYDSFSYLSTARFYKGLASSHEQSDIVVNPSDPEHLLDLSKLSGEALVARMAGDRGRIIRLSNVFGDNHAAPTFLSSILRAAAGDGRVLFRTAPRSSKDYVAVEDVAELLPRIAAEATERVYNISSGQAVRNEEIAVALERLGVAVAFEEGAEETLFPAVENRRVRDEFGFAPVALLDRLPDLLADYRRIFPKP